MKGQSNSAPYINIYTASRTDPEVLEAIFVQRELLLSDIVERVIESTKTRNKHHQLVVGSRGSGKTALVTLLVHRLKKQTIVQENLKIAWFNEDETSVLFLDILLNIFKSLNKRYPNDYSIEELEKAFDYNKKEAQDYLSNLLSEKLKKSKSTCLIIIENLDALFESIGKTGQQQLRAYLQENPYFTIFATAQKLTDSLKDRKDPFFGFFQTDHLTALDAEEASELISKIAKLSNNSEIEKFLKTNTGKSRIKALHHLAGGNHRMYIVLSQFITKDSIDDLVKPFMKMVDELTPYYQERLRWLPAQQRKVIELLCATRNTVSVKNIAKRLFSSNQSISSQLVDLKDKGYVKSHKRGRESLYEITEPLMRICIEVKENKSDRPIEILVDFIKSWYGNKDIERKLNAEKITKVSHVYLSAALEKTKLLQSNIEKSELNNQVQKEGNNKINDLSIPELTKIIDSKETSISGLLQALMNRATLFYYENKLKKYFNDLTRVIESPDASVERVAQALINRGFTHGEQGDVKKELSDYTRVIELPDAPVERVAKALYNRGITYGEQGDVKKALSDYTRVIELPDAPIEQVAKALINRGITHGEQGDVKKELSDYTRVIELPDAPVERVAKALYNRGITYGEQGDVKKALSDYTRLIELPDAPVERVAQALYNRGITYGKQGDVKKKLSDYTRVIELPDAPIEQVAKALYNRGVTHGEQGDVKKELSDYTRVIELPDAPIEQVAKALINRGITHGEQGDVKKALSDYTRVIELPDASVERVAQALINRGITHGEQGDVKKELSDYTRVIELPDAPVERVAKALYNRGITYGEQGDVKKALSDYTRLIELPDAPVERVAQALYNRGITYGEQGDVKKKLSDYTRVIELPDAPIEQVAKALYNRGVTHGEQGDVKKELSDYTRVIELPDASVERVAKALISRGATYFNAHQEVEKSLNEFQVVINNKELKSAGLLVNAYMNSAEVYISQNRWKEAIESMLNGLMVEIEGENEASRKYNTPDIIKAVYENTLDTALRNSRISEMVNLFIKNKTALAELNVSLIEHLGVLYKADSKSLQDNLNSWLAAWALAMKDIEEMSVTLRMFSVGIAFLGSDEKDEQILLDLIDSERKILRQAFDLDEIVR